MKNSKKIGVLDIIIIILVIGMGFYLTKSFRGKSGPGKATTPIVYTFEAEDVGQEFINQMEIGKDVYNSQKNHYVGKIKDFTVMPYEEEYEDTKNGVIKMVEIPDRYTVLIDIEADAVIENDVILAGNEQIRVGLYLPIKGKSFASYGYILGIERGN